MVKKLLLLALVSCSAVADFVIINPLCIRNTDRNEFYVCFEDNQFYIVNTKEETIKAVSMAFSDKMIRRFDNQEELDAFFEHDGQIIVRQFEDGTYWLQSHMRVRGGGPTTAGLAWLGTHIVCYTALFTAMIGINIALPGVGTPAVVIATGGSLTATMASIEAVAAKAFFIGLAAPTP